MDQVKVGVLCFLEFPRIHETFQRVIGATAAKKRLIDTFLKPFPGAKILDIGCGTGQIVEDLPPKTHYVGYDLSPRYIAYAKREYGARGEFFCARVSNAQSHPMAGQFDFVLALGILHHLDDSEAVKLFETVRQHLKHGGVALTFDAVYTENQSAIVRYLISRDRGQHVRSPEEYVQLATGYFSSTEAHVLTNMLRIPHTLFVMRCTR